MSCAWAPCATLDFAHDIFIDQLRTVDQLLDHRFAGSQHRGTSGQARQLECAHPLVDLLPGQAVDVPLYWQCWRLDVAALRVLTAAVQRQAALSLGD